MTGVEWSGGVELHLLVAASFLNSLHPASTGQNIRYWPFRLHLDSTGWRSVRFLSTLCRS